MNQDRESKFRFYSIGIVLEDKGRDSDEIKVFPVEDLPLVDGKVTDYKPKYDVNLPDSKNINRSSAVEGSAIIVAKWIPDGASNRVTSPDVIKNETVKIYRYADTDEYYWATIFREPGIRRLETVCYMYGNLQAPLEKWDKNSSYWMEVSTHDKSIHMHTTTTDGEPFVYDIKLNTAEGVLTIKDDMGNFIELNSATNRITAVANTDIILKAPEIYLDGNVTISGNLGVGGKTDSVGRIATSATLHASGGCMSSEHPCASEGAVVGSVPPASPAF